jgi:ABC-type nitrate/sulfonate/bicarbonate transport system substrate-binding protein
MRPSWTAFADFVWCHCKWISMSVGLATALVASGGAQAQTKIVAGMVAHGPPQWPQYVADEFGWFKQDKIDLELVTIGGGGVAQLAAGSLDTRTVAILTSPARHSTARR